MKQQYFRQIERAGARAGTGDRRILSRGWIPIAAILVSMLGALVAGCGDDQDPGGASAFWQRIQSEQYRNWARAPGYEQRRPSNTSHADAVDIFVNATVEAAQDAAAPLDAWPVGAVIVKDAYDGSSLHAVAAMEKRDNGWYWVEWNAEGESIYSGTPSLCIECHASGQDSVRAFGLPK